MKQSCFVGGGSLVLFLVGGRGVTWVLLFFPTILVLILND